MPSVRQVRLWSFCRRHQTVEDNIYQLSSWIFACAVWIKSVMRNTAGERKSNLIKDSASLQIDVDEDKPDAFKLIMCVYK